MLLKNKKFIWSGYLIVLILFTIYICSFLWFKFGLSEAQTFFGYTGISATNDIEICDVSKDDLIWAKELYYGEELDEFDLVLVKETDSYNIKTFQSKNISDDGDVTYNLIDKSNNITVVSNKNIIGEVIASLNGIGPIYEILVSPIFVSIILSIIFISSIIILQNKKKKETSEKCVDRKINFDINSDGLKTNQEKTIGIMDKSSSQTHITDVDDVFDSEDETIQNKKIPTIEEKDMLYEELNSNENLSTTICNSEETTSIVATEPSTEAPTEIETDNNCITSDDIEVEDTTTDIPSEEYVYTAIDENIEEYNSNQVIDVNCNTITTGIGEEPHIINDVPEYYMDTDEVCLTNTRTDINRKTSKKKKSKKKKSKKKKSKKKKSKK